MMFAHIGMAFLVVGVAGSSAWKEELIVSIMPGDKISIAKETIIFNDVEIRNTSNYQTLMGYFILKEKNITLIPEKRVYNQPQQLTTEAAIYSNFWSDIYLVIGDGPDNDGNYTVRAFFEPFIPFLWYGILMMGVGGILAITDKNLRITSRRSKQI